MFYAPPLKEMGQVDKNVKNDINIHLYGVCFFSEIGCVCYGQMNQRSHMRNRTQKGDGISVSFVTNSLHCKNRKHVFTT